MDIPELNPCFTTCLKAPRGCGSQGTVAWVEDLKISSCQMVLGLPDSHVNRISWVVGDPSAAPQDGGFRIFLVAENMKTLVAGAWV